MSLDKSDTDQVPGKQGEAVPGQSDILCQPCLKKDKRTTALVFCKTCNELQCTGCSSLHKDFAFMENHELVEAKEADSLPRSCDMKGLDICDKHRKLLEFFCEDEKSLCCSSCAIVDHRKCHSVVEIHGIAKKSSSVDSESMIKLLDTKAKAELVVQQTQEAKERIDQDIKEITLKIERMRDDVIKMFDDVEAFVARKTEAFKTDAIKKPAKKQATCVTNIAEVTKSLETIDNMYQNGTPSQQSIVEHKLKEYVNELQTKFEEICRNLESVTVAFEFDETLKIPPLPIAEYIPGQITLKYNISDTVISIVDEDPILKLEKITSIDLKQTGDNVREPLYTGLDFLSDGRLVAVENYNKKCLIFSEKLEKIGSYQLSYPPQSVVAISEEEAAITGSGEYKIDFLHISKSNEITLIRTSNVKTEYDSICMKDDGNFVVGTIDHTRPVRIVALSGEEKDFNISFPNKTYPEDTSACTYIRNSDKVVLTDRYEHTVDIYDIVTNTRIVVKDDQIKEPCGVVVGPSDCILACCWEADSIVQISQTGRILSSYKLDARVPYRVCVSENKTILAVATNWVGNMKLQLFRITR